MSFNSASETLRNWNYIMAQYMVAQWKSSFPPNFRDAHTSRLFFAGYSEELLRTGSALGSYSLPLCVRWREGGGRTSSSGITAFVVFHVFSLARSSKNASCCEKTLARAPSFPYLACPTTFFFTQNSLSPSRDTPFERLLRANVWGRNVNCKRVYKLINVRERETTEKHERN